MIHKFQYVDKLKNKIKHRYSICNKKQIVKLLGHYSIGQLQEKIDSVLRDDFLELNFIMDHFRHESKEFLGKLSFVLGIDDELYQQSIGEITIFLNTYYRYIPSIEIKTDFKMDEYNGPIYALNIMACYRSMKIGIDHFTTDREIQVGVATQIANMHKKYVGDELPMWGKVVGYEYHYNDQDSIALSIVCNKDNG